MTELSAQGFSRELIGIMARRVHPVTVVSAHDPARYQNMKYGRERYQTFRYGSWKFSTPKDSGKDAQSATMALRPPLGPCETGRSRPSQAICHQVKPIEDQNSTLTFILMRHQAASRYDISMRTELIA